MDNLFITVMNMSITASFVILIILAARWFLRRAGAPKWILCALWAVVFFRLLCPVSFLSEYSLLQMLPQSDVIQTQSGAQMQYMERITVEQLPLQDISTEAEQVSNVDAMPTEGVTVPAVPVMDNTTLQVNVLSGLPFFWLLGVFLFAAYGAYHFIRLRRRVATATLVEKNIYESDQISGPFVMGVFEPQIYLPLNLNDEARQYILQHEYGHFYRGDLWYKRIAYVALLLHWFNPLVHLAYYLLEQDMEQACDEKVLSQLGNEHKTAYSTTLLNMAMGRQKLLLPLAFCESKTKQRIRNILQYRRVPKEALGVFVLLAVIISMVCVSNPVEFDAWGYPILEETASYKPMPDSANPHNSIIERTYWEDETVQFNKIYQILLPDNPLDLYGDIRVRENEMYGNIILNTRNYQDFLVAKEQAKQYMLVLMALQQWENIHMDIYHYNVTHSLDLYEGVEDKYTHCAGKISEYSKSQAGLHQLLTELGVEQAGEKATLLWSIGQEMEQRKQRMEVVKKNALYDTYGTVFRVQPANRDETEKYRVLYSLDEEDILREWQHPTELDYQKLAVTLFALYQNLERAEFAFIGSLEEYQGEESDLLCYNRADLERQFGPLQLDENDLMAAQLSDLEYLMRKADSLNVPQVTAKPQMPFYEKLRRIEIEPARPIVDRCINSYVRFSLLPDQAPLDGSCYLRINVVTNPEKVEQAGGSSELWIYGQKAKWQEYYPPVLTWQGEKPDYCKILCRGQYEIVVSRWDDELRSALEDLGGEAELVRSVPWTVVYRGTLTFEQQLPLECFMGW